VVLLVSEWDSHMGECVLVRSGPLCPRHTQAAPKQPAQQPRDSGLRTQDSGTRAPLPPGARSFPPRGGHVTLMNWGLTNPQFAVSICSCAGSRRATLAAPHLQIMVVKFQSETGGSAGGYPCGRLQAAQVYTSFLRGLYSTVRIPVVTDHCVCPGIQWSPLSGDHWSPLSGVRIQWYTVDW